MASIFLLLLSAGAISADASVRHDVTLPRTSSEVPVDVVDRYIVRLRPETNLTDHIDSAHKIAATTDGHEGLTHQYSFLSFHGYAGHFSTALVATLHNRTDVISIEPDAIFTAASLTEEKRVPYGLDQISHRTPSTGRSGSYAYDSSAAAGTYAYIVDAGIDCDHRDLRGRCTLGHNAVKNVPFSDPGGHGTHVAGIVGGTLYGVAKKTNLVAVKVMHRTRTTGATMLAGYQWAVQDVLAKKRVGTAVINVSVTGPLLKSLNDAVDQATAKGITTVCAAGNEGVAAKGTSPASAKGCITVGATDKAKKRASTSNWGSEVDVFAPGWISSPTLLAVTWLPPS